MTAEHTGALPIPNITDEDRLFWEGVQHGKFLIQKCLDCNMLQFYPRFICIRCFGKNLGWQESRGVGTIYSFTPVLLPLHPVLRKKVEETKIPVLFAKIDLDEGVRIISEIVGSKLEDVKIGARVQLVFEEAEGTNFKLPKFRLIK